MRMNHIGHDRIERDWRISRRSRRKMLSCRLRFEPCGILCFVQVVHIDCPSPLDPPRIQSHREGSDVRPRGREREIGRPTKPGGLKISTES